MGVLSCVGGDDPHILRQPHDEHVHECKTLLIAVNNQMKAIVCTRTRTGSYMPGNDCSERRGFNPTDVSVICHPVTCHDDEDYMMVYSGYRKIEASGNISIHVLSSKRVYLLLSYMT